MDRRSFLRASAVGGGTLAASSLAAPAIAQGRETLTMVCTWPRGAAGVWDAVERFSSNVADITGGALTIDAKAAGELVGPFEVFDATASGQADMYHSADYYYVGQSPALAFFTTVPFGMTTPELMIWYYYGEGRALHHEVGEVFGLRPFIAGQTGPQGGGWYRKPIEAVEDFQGLKFRMPGFGGQALAKVGASVQNVAPGEIYQALSSGALDGTEWTGPWSDEALGIPEVAQHYYPAGFHEPGAALTAAVNLDRFNSLSPQHQRAIEVAAAESHQHNYALFVGNNGPALQRLVAGGTQIHEYSPAIWDAFGAASKEVLGQFMTDPLFAKVHASMTASMTATAGWLGITDGVYQAQRTRVLGAL